MSLLPDFPTVERNDFGGAWLLSDPSMVPARGAILAKNVEFFDGEVASRRGFASTAHSKISPTTATEMYAWYGPFSNTGATGTLGDENLVVFSPIHNGPTTPGYEILNVADAVNFSAVSTCVATTAGASFVGVGMRLYGVFHNANQYAVAGQGGQAIALSIVGGFLAYAGGSATMFGGPMTYVLPAPTEPGAGVVTAGIHRFGYLLEYNTGFTTRVSPDSGATTPPSVDTFTPTSFTAAGAKNLSFALNPAASNWAQDVVAVSLVMTTTTNLNQYYIVPGTRTAIANSTDYPKTITFNISDADLASRGTDATPYLYWLTNSPTYPSATVPGFLPSHLCLWGDRMAYRGHTVDNLGNKVDAIAVSERNNYQAITADQHILQLPGQRSTTTMFRMGTVNYIVGPHEIFGTSDNGDVPVTWPTPQLIDGRHGTLAIHGAEVAPSGNYAWLADQGGLFVFTGGPLTGLPVSYEQSPDWDRINWQVAYTLKIRDDAGRKVVYVMAALDGATAPSHIMMWDYSAGISYESVRYSLQSLSTYALGSMELVRNDLTGQVTGNQKKIELWLGPRTSAAVLRQLTDLDTTPYRDNGLAIASQYRTCPLPGRSAAAGLINMHHGFGARITGAGSLTPLVYDIDAVRSFTCRAATLATAPNEDLLFLADLRSELAFVDFSTSTLDTHWNIAYLRWYYSPYLIQR